LGGFVHPFFASLNRRWLWLAALPLLLLAWLCIRPHHSPDDGKLRLTVIDVGQGDCLLLQTPNGRTVLIDGGGANDETQAAQSEIGEKVVVPFLHYEGIDRLDVLVITHPHGDHVGGLSAVLREEQVGVVLDGTCLPYPSPAYTNVLALIHQKHIPYVRAVRGMRLTLDRGVTADVLNPPSSGLIYGTDPNNDTMNNYSAVLRVTYGRTHLLLDGDAEKEAEASMLAAYGDLSCDVLKCGHHGSSNASSDAWLDRVQPRFAAISCGLHNPFGHPNPATLTRLSAHNIKVFRTDKNGAITFVSDGQTVTAKPFLP
jgi:competence protein ComEC